MRRRFLMFFSKARRMTLRELLDRLERKFNGDVFTLPEDTKHRLTTKELHRFAELVESKTIKAQRYLGTVFVSAHSRRSA